VEGPGGHRDRRHHDGAGQERRARRRVRHPRGRRPAAAAGHRARPHGDLPLDQRRDRRLPRRRERPGRPARRQLRPRHPQPRRPRLLLHAPLDPVLRRRRGPGLADQERREIGPPHDHPHPARRLRAGHAARIRRHADPAPEGSRRPPRGPAPGHHRPARHLHRHHRDPQRPDQDHPDAGADHPAGPPGIPGPRDRSPVCREMANRSRPPLLPVKRDSLFTAAPFVLLLAFSRFPAGAVPSGRGCSSRAGGSCARGGRPADARRRG